MAVPGEALRASLRALINDAAIGARAWGEAVSAMRGAFQVDLTTLEMIDLATGAATVVTDEPLEERTLAEYQQHYIHINPRLAVDDPVLMKVYSEHEIAPELVAQSGEYYDWIAHHRIPRWSAGGLLINDRAHFAVCAMMNHAGHGPPSVETETAWGAMMPHVANALEIARMLALRGRTPDLLDTAETAGGRAFAFLRADGTVAEPSEGFLRAIAGHASLTLRDGRLLSAREADRRALAALLARAVTCAAMAPAPARLGAADGRQGLVLRAVPLAAGRDLFARLRPVALLVLTDLDAPVAASAAELSAVWGLTRREAELAQLVGRGRSIGQAAATLGISEGTARHHLKSIFRRMDIDRQGELVRLVARLSA